MKWIEWALVIILTSVTRRSCITIYKNTYIVRDYSVKKIGRKP